MTLLEILKTALDRGASDVFVVPGSAVAVKMGGAVVPLTAERLRPADSLNLIRQVYHIANRGMDRLTETGDEDFSLSVANLGRFRCSAFRQRNSLAMVLRIVSFDLPDPDAFNIPKAVIDLHKTRKGLVLVTGPAGSGKSTTLACMIDKINQNYQDHIITIEDPIEFIHPHKRSIVSQREVEFDTMTYGAALRSALRQAPDVILLGEMRDFETIQTALTAAETGQLVLSTLHTIGAAKTIDRIIDVFPPNQQQQIRIQLSMVLKAVVSQQLIPTVDGQLAGAFEIMQVNSAVQNMIRESKVFQLDNVIYSGAAQGMRAMDDEVYKLYTSGRISREHALLFAANFDVMNKRMAQRG